MVFLDEPTIGLDVSVKARIRAFDELVEAQENRSPSKAQILIQVPERLGGKVIDEGP